MKIKQIAIDEALELLRTLLDHPGMVLISGYDNDMYNEVLSGWNKASLSTRAEGGRRRTEVLWMNYAREGKQMELII